MQRPATLFPSADTRFRLSVTYRPIGELKPDPVNPRLHSKKQIRQIANSIREFGFNTPVLIDRDGNVMCGHGRLLACRELGMTEVPTVRLDHLTPAQARAFMIADNRLTEIATWDDRLLAEQLRDLTLLGLGPQADGHILLEQERLMAVVVGVTEHLSPCVGRVAKNGKRQNDYAQDF